MTMTISLSPDAEARLRERAAAAGIEPTRYAAELLEDMVTKPTLDELLAPFRKEVADSGMSDEQLESFYEDLRNEAWDEKHGRQP